MMKKRRMRLLSMIVAVILSVNICGVTAAAEQITEGDLSSEQVYEIPSEEVVHDEEATGQEVFRAETPNVPENSELSENLTDDTSSDYAMQDPSASEIENVSEEDTSDNNQNPEDSADVTDEPDLSAIDLNPETELGNSVMEETDREREAREKAEKEGAEIIPLTEGPTYTSNHMWYRYNGEIDIRGYENDDVVQTTYSDCGYMTMLECDGSNEHLSFYENGVAVSHSSGLTVTPSVSFSEDGSYAIVKYVVNNPTSSRKIYNMGVHADVDIASDDYASVHRTANGLSMVNTSTDKTYYLICKNISGTTSAGTLWFGYYSDRWDNVYNDTSLSELTGTDSGLAFSWKNRTITAGSSATYVYQIGIGETGAIVDYSERGRGFTIGEDTNSFSHSMTAFYNGTWKNQSDVNWFEQLHYSFTKTGKYYDSRKQYFVVSKDNEPDGLTYKTSDNYFNRLVSGQNFFKKCLIQDEMNNLWGGSCHGIAVSMALISQGINLSESGISTDYHSSSAPKDNRQLRNTINFYQLSQYLESGSETEQVNPKDTTAERHSFLTNLAQEGMRSESERKPFVLSFGHTDSDGNKSGHSIVVYGAEKLDSNNYRLRLYDENGCSVITMSLNVRNNTFSFTDGNGNNISNTNYNYLSYTGIDKLYSTISTLETSDTNDYSQLIISAYKKVLITNERGEYLQYDGNDYSGSMTVYDMRFVGEGDNQRIIFYVDDYESLTVNDMEEQIKISADIDDEYYTVESENADSLIVESGNIKIEGDNYTFSAGTSAGTENTELVKVSAESSGETVLNTGEGDITVKAENSLSSAVVTNYDDTTVTESKITGASENIDIKDNDEGTIDIERDEAPMSIEKASVSGISLSYGYTGKAYTPAMTVTVDGIVLTKGTDYTVKYTNNIKPGTAKIIITGKGSYTGTRIKTFNIVDCVSKLVSGKTYQFIPKNNSTTAVCSFSGRMVNNTKVYITNRSSSEAMRFKAVKNSDGSWKFINAKCELALAVQQNSTEVGKGLVLYDQTTKKAQNWKLVRKFDNSFAIVNAASGLYVSMSDMSAPKGTLLTMHENSGRGDQRFYIVETSAVSAPYDGTYAIKASKNKAYGLNVASSSKADGANVNLYKYSNVNAKKFKAVYSGGGYYRLVNVNSGLVLSVNGNTKASGANVKQSKWQGQSGQRWKIIKNSNGTVTLKNALGTVLHLNGNKTANGTNVVARKAATTGAQKWYMVKA